MRLSEAAVGTKVRVVSTHFPPALQNRILGLGFVPGSVVEVVREAPLGDPRVYLVRGKLITLRNDEAAMIEVQPIGKELPLSMARIGREYVVKDFMGGAFFMSRVSSLGLRQGSRIRILSKYPLVAFVNGRQVRIGMGMAERIIVEEV